MNKSEDIMIMKKRLYLPLGSSVLPILVSDLNEFMAVKYGDFPEQLRFIEEDSTLKYQLNNEQTMNFSFKRLTLALQTTESLSDLQLLEFIQELTQRLGASLRILLQDFVLQTVSEDSKLVLLDDACTLHFEIDSLTEEAKFSLSFPAKYNKLTQLEVISALETLDLGETVSLKAKKFRGIGYRGVELKISF
ncbi:hypothetical protein [Ligilactobacillus agilis]|uniref:hypothetical protein n=1 Tax=Ligilactobacillus agilis TaxID=1601 RepID=UPI001868E6FA|nr:hypothetical protein [Ligilactobacillus agilis]